MKVKILSAQLAFFAILNLGFSVLRRLLLKGQRGKAKDNNSMC